MGRVEEWETCAAHSAPAGFLSCRRAASFPYFGEHEIVPSSALKTRSQSESEGLNRARLCGYSIESLRSLLKDAIIEKEERSDCESNGTSSGCDSEEEDQFPTVTADTSVAENSYAANEIVISPPRKKVSFADECGQELAQVRVVNTKEPFVVSPDVLQRYGGSKKSLHRGVPRRPLRTWVVRFSQPAADYTKFRERLERAKVSLENAFIKSDSGRMMGTIKVMNLTFEKRVFIRYTTNGWASYLDIAAKHQPGTSRLHDIFTFELELPKDHERSTSLEFCICYVANGEEHWDSQDGKNYRVEVDDEKRQPALDQPSHNYQQSPTHWSFSSDDAYRMEMSDWSRFAAWKSLSTDGPYW